MSKKISKTVLIITSVCIVFCIIELISILASLHIESPEETQKREATNQALLQDVSRRLGKNFQNWTELRGYVYCDLLKEGMMREEVEKDLSVIGKIYSYDTSIDFENHILDYNLAPIIVTFDARGPTGRLKGGEGHRTRILALPERVVR